ncbi:MAG: lipoate--protein ligase family protein [Candidatus Omnitrophota bacterium]
MSQPRLRLILDCARSAVFNMAVDEVLMEAESDSDRQGTLRFYDWQTPSITIGYFQSVERVRRRFDCDASGAEVVRRPTGGGVVFHGKDLTFSLCLKNPNPLLPTEPKESYRSVNQIVGRALAELLPGTSLQTLETLPSGRAQLERVCFVSPSACDLMQGDRKIVGAAQRRRSGALLHQSSIDLDFDRGHMIRLIVAGFCKYWNVEFEQAPLSRPELAAAQALVETKYSKNDYSWHPAGKPIAAESAKMVES